MYIGVGHYPVIQTSETLALTLSYLINPSGDLIRGFSSSVVGQFLKKYAKDFDVDVDTIEHGAGDPFLIAGDAGEGTGAFFVALEVPTRAGIHTTGKFFEGKHEIIVPVSSMPWTITSCVSFQVWA